MFVFANKQQNVLYKSNSVKIHLLFRALWFSAPCAAGDLRPEFLTA